MINLFTHLTLIDMFKLMTLLFIELMIVPYNYNVMKEYQVYMGQNSRFWNGMLISQIGYD